MRSLQFSVEAWNDYLLWQQQDKKILQRINELLKVACRTPFDGIGKPEPLKGQLSGLWSRRIDGSHRLVYAVDDVHITVISCRLHY